MSVTAMPGRLQRLDQRIGQPLRQLVDRHEAVGRVVAPDARDGASSRRAARRPALSRPGQIGPSCSSSDLEDAGAGSLPSSAAPDDRTARRPWRRTAKTSGRPRPPRPAGAAAPRGLRGPTSGLSSRHLERLRQTSPRRCRASRVGAQRIVRIGRHGAGLEHPQRGDAQALGAGQLRAGRGVAIAPGRPGAGVQQHRGDRQVERRARQRPSDPARLRARSAQRSRPSSAKCRQRAWNGTFRSG